jgi:hypothetical protein
LTEAKWRLVVVALANTELVTIARKGADAIRKWRESHPGEFMDLSRVDLSEADLSGAKLSRASLFGARLFAANLSGADIRVANLCEADLTGANLFGASLIDANLSGAVLNEAQLGSTVIARCFLLSAQGLGNVRHLSPSSVDVDTLILSIRGTGGVLTGELEGFFRNAGVPKELLDALPGIATEIKYCRIFVGYGQPDLAFADKLVDDLRRRGVSCWLYTRDHTAGEDTWREIDRRQQEAEKMIAICSAESLMQDGVLKELERQIDEDPEKVIPISRDNLWKKDGFLIMRAGHDLKPFLMRRNYADFSDPSKYEVSLDSLLKALER